MTLSTTSKIRSFGIVASAATFILLSPTVAQADSDPDITEPTALIADLGIDEAAPHGSMGEPVVPTPLAESATFEIPSQVSEMPDITFTVPSEDAIATTDGEFSVITSGDGTAATWARPMPTGGQVIFAATDEDGLDGFQIDLDVQVESVTQIEDGYILSLPSDVSLLVHLPWAYDGNGEQLATSLSFEGNSIIQHIAVDASTTYPVVADPQWTYLMEFYIRHNAFDVRDLLKEDGKFTHIFPVPVAPDDFPVPDQFLPLTMGFDGSGIMNFNCYMNGDGSEGVQGGGQDWSYSFRSAPGHIDGAGSNITFRFVSVSGKTTLYIFAQITNPEPGGVPQWFYEAGARLMWTQFQTNVNLEMI